MPLTAHVGRLSGINTPTAYSGELRPQDHKLTKQQTQNSHTSTEQVVNKSRSVKFIIRIYLSVYCTHLGHPGAEHSLYVCEDGQNNLGRWQGGVLFPEIQTAC